MCGRFSLTVPKAELLARFSLSSIPSYTPRYNIAPSQEILVVKKDYQAELMRWGLVPSWSKNSQEFINVRGESILKKPYFSKSAQERRIIIPADGFFEWKNKVPYYFKTGKLFSFAGIYDEKEGVKSCAIITISPNDSVKPYHERMPVILDAESEQKWLEGDFSVVATNPISFEGVQVSSKVNSPSFDTPDVLFPESTLGKFL